MSTSRGHSLTAVGAARCALIATGALAFSTGFDNYAFTVWSGPKPLYLVYVFVLAAAASFVGGLSRPVPLWRSALLAWVLAFFFLTTTWALWMRSSAEVSQVLFDRYRSMATLLAFGVLLADSRARRVGVIAIVAAAAFDGVANVAESLGLVVFPDPASLRVPGRAAGFFINSNGAGLAIVLGLAVGVNRLPRAWRAPLLVIGAVGVAATFSRGAAICFAVLILALALRREVGGSAVLLFAALVFLVIAYGDSLVRFLEARDVLNENTWAHARFEGDSGRTEVAVKALDMFLRSPFVGNGIGATIDWDQAASSHNMYLNLAGDHGVLGLLLLPLLAVGIGASDRRSIPFALVLMAAGIFSHNLFDDRASLLAIAVAAAGGSRPEVRPTESPRRFAGAPGSTSCILHV